MMEEYQSIMKNDVWDIVPRLERKSMVTVIHQVAQAGFPEKPPKDEQALLIHTEFSYSAGPEKAHFSVFPLL